jgi:hypothetical protein
MRWKVLAVGIVLSAGRRKVHEGGASRRTFALSDVVISFLSS